MKQSMLANTCQVCPGHDGHIDAAAGAGAGGDEEKEKAKLELQRRHCFWVKRKAVSGGFSSWRPAKRHRLAAKHWLSNLDNQVRQCLPLEGLSGFQLSKQRAGLWAGWRSWPHLSIAMDQGSDAVAATWYLHHLGANITAWPDWSHGSWNDTKNMLKESGLFPFWLLMMITFNMPHGPFNDDARHSQVTGAWDECRRHFTAQTCPLFLEHLPQILDDMGGQSALGGDPSAGLDEQVWQAMAEDPPMRRKGYKCNLNRFFGGTKTARELLPLWHMKLFQYEYTALECGMLATRKVEKIMVQQGALEPEDAPENEKPSTCSTRVTVDEKALRSCCQNSLVISVAMLGDGHHNVLVRMILAIAGPVEAWHSEQNSTLRSAGASASWLLVQLKGGFMNHIHQILEKLSKVAVLEHCKFELPGQDAPLHRDGDQADAHLMRLLREDDLADLMGDMAMSMASMRLQRCLWAVSGWPVRMAAILGDEGLAEATIMDFKLDYEAFEKLKRQEQKTAAMETLLHRSVFQQVSVQQYVEAMPSKSTINIERGFTNKSSPGDLSTRHNDIHPHNDTHFVELQCGRRDSLMLLRH